MGTFSSFDISASGIYAQRVRMDAVANNIANAETTRTAEGGPYKRQSVSFRAVYEDAVGNQVNPAGVSGGRGCLHRAAFGLCTTPVTPTPTPMATSECPT